MTASNQVATILGAVAANAVPTEALQKTQAPTQELARQGIVTLGMAALGGILGGVFWKKHRVLGVFGGMGAGAVAGDALTGQYAQAGFQALTTVAAVGLSLKWKSHPALGYIGGLVAGTIVEGVASQSSPIRRALGK